MSAIPQDQRHLSPQYWLINARSGNGAGDRLLNELQGISHVVAVVINFASLVEQVSSIPSEATIVVAGGDGTFASVLSLPEVKTRKVACIPLGTANDLSRELGISSLVKRLSTQEMPEKITTLPTRPFALWNVVVDGRDLSFANYLSIGYEGAVVRDFAAWRSRTTLSGKITNRIAYTLFGLAHSLKRIQGLSVCTETGAPQNVPTTTGIILTNIKSHLGLGLSNSESSPSDEVIECVSVPTVLGFTAMIGASLRILSPPKVFTQGKSITISGIPHNTPMQIDGEAAPPILHGELTVSLRHFATVSTARGR
jgi:diacylglycerol kinase family enzyme